MDWDLYDFEGHWHPSDPTVVGFVAYPRRDAKGGWDLFALVSPGEVPGWDAALTDDGHVFLAHAAEHYDLDAAVARVEAALGDGYQQAPYYREAGGRVVIGRIYDHLRAAGAHRMSVSRDGADDWVLYIRRKDFPVAAGFLPPNVPG